MKGLHTVRYRRVFLDVLECYIIQFFLSMSHLVVCVDVPKCQQLGELLAILGMGNHDNIARQLRVLSNTTVYKNVRVVLTLQKNHLVLNETPSRKSDFFATWNDTLLVTVRAVYF